MHKIKRVLHIVLDACGCGNAPDAAMYGDEGANTLLHVVEQRKHHQRQDRKADIECQIFQNRAFLLLFHIVSLPCVFPFGLQGHCKAQS